MSQLPKRKEKPDGYRPVTLPKAAKMINLRNIDRNEEELNSAANNMQTKKQIVKSVTYNLPVLDFEKAGEWYSKHLGFEYIEPKDGEMKLPDGTWISFFTPDTNEDSMWYIGGDMSQYRSGLVFRVADLDHLHKELKDAGVRVTDIGGQGSKCGRFFDFYDLNGLKLGAWEGYLEGHRHYHAQT